MFCFIRHGGREAGCEAGRGPVGRAEAGYGGVGDWRPRNGDVPAGICTPQTVFCLFGLAGGFPFNPQGSHFEQIRKRTAQRSRGSNPLGFLRQPCAGVGFKLVSGDRQLGNVHPLLTRLTPLSCSVPPCFPFFGGCPKKSVCPKKAFLVFPGPLNT